jgi:hypothetical protein
MGNAILGEFHPLLLRHHRPQHEIRGRDVDAGAMQIEIRRHAFEGAGAVEDRRAEPGGMGARPHDRHIAGVPIVVEKRPGRRMHRVGLLPPGADRLRV